MGQHLREMASRWDQQVTKSQSLHATRSQELTLKNKKCCCLVQGRAPFRSRRQFHATPQHHCTCTKHVLNSEFLTSLTFFSFPSVRSSFRFGREDSDPGHVISSSSRFPRLWRAPCPSRSAAFSLILSHVLPVSSPRHYERCSSSLAEFIFASMMTSASPQMFRHGDTLKWVPLRTS